MPACFTGHVLLKLNQYDLGVRPETHRRSPRSSPARGIDKEVAKALQPVCILLVDAGHNPSEGEKLSPVRMPGELQGNPFFLSDVQMARLVEQQYAGLLTVQRRL